MKTSGWFSINRNIFEKMDGYPNDLKVLWYWIVGQADFKGPNIGTFTATMSDFKGAIRERKGAGFTVPGNKRIYRYLKRLSDGCKVSVSMSMVNSEATYTVKVLNYKEYQERKSVNVPVNVCVNGQINTSTPIIVNKYNKTAPAAPAAVNFNFGKKVPCPKDLIEVAGNGSIPENFKDWFILKTTRDFKFTPELAEKCYQNQFEQFVAHATYTGRTCKDWYSAWQKWILVYKSNGHAERDRANFEKHYNHGWEESHRENKNVRSQLPPEIRVPDKWQPGE